jgi:hypothetical protein
MSKADFILESNVIVIVKRDLPFNISPLVVKKKLESLGARNVILASDGDARVVRLTCSTYNNQSDSINKYLDSI